MPGHQDQLTQFREAEDSTTTVHPMSPMMMYKSISNSYPDQTPHQILTRNYQVATLTWSPAGINPPSLIFPATLFVSAPILLQRLVNFRYLRAGIKLEFRFNSTAYHYGAFMISWLPAHTGTAHANTAFKRSGNHPMMVSAAQQDAVTLTVPWINPHLYTDLGVVAANLNASICTVYFDSILPLRTSIPGVTDTLTVQVFASLVDPEVSGFVAQSGKYKAEAKVKSKQGLINEDTNVITSLISKIPMLGEIGSMLETMALFDKPTSNQASQPTSLSFSRCAAMGEGLELTNPLSLLPNSYLPFDPSLMGDDGDMTLIGNIVQVPMLHAAFEWTTNLPQFRMLAGPVVDAGREDYFSRMARLFTYWRGSVKYCIQFYCTPFTSARFRISILYNNPTNLDAQIGDVPSMVVDVKGDTTCNFTVPYLFPQMYQLTSDISQLPTVRISLVNPIVGVSSSSPAIQLFIWRAAGEDLVFSQAVDYFTEFTSAEPQAEQNVLSEVFKANSDVRLIFKKTFPPVVEGCTFGQEKGVVTAEHISSIRQLIRRFTYAPRQANDLARPLFEPNMGVGDGAAPINVIATMFKYYRGSRRAKVIMDKNTINALPVDYLPVSMARSPLDQTFSVTNGVAFTQPSQWLPLEFEIPYYCRNPFVPVDSTTSFEYSNADAPASAAFGLPPTQSYATSVALFAAGDDFTFGFLCAPL